MLLGAAAGGGFPQWNCWCPMCEATRTSPGRARRRTQSSIAVSTDGRRWFLCNASPDVREQMERLPADRTTDVRRSPVERIVLTDAEIDHTLGIVLLREGQELHLCATRAVLDTLERDSRILAITRAFAQVTVSELALDAPAPLLYREGEPSGLEVEAFAVPGDPPRFAGASARGHTVGLIVHDRMSGGTCAYVPGCGAVGAELRERLGAADVLLFDGTFWSDDELIALGVGTRRARDIGHVPISGDGGSLAALAGLPCQWKVYTHINNTNPILLEDSPERASVRGMGWDVGADGMRFDV